MNINNDISIKTVKINKKTEQPDISKNYTTDNKTGIVLPDIRSNQILLPNNKIFVPSGLNAEFNKKNISIEIPINYKKVDEQKENPITKIAREKYEHSKVAQYENTQTGTNIVRVSKNIFSDKGELNSAEVIEIDTKNPRQAIRYIKDFEHNSETEIKISNPLESRKTKNEAMTTIYKNESGKIVKTEEYKKSVIAGLYDITETDAAGNKTIIAQTTKDELGNVIVEKHLVSLDGTKTDYRYESDKNGHHKKLFTQITDANGNVLSTIDKTYDKENENVTYSSVNGNKFKAEKKDGNLEITNYQTGEKSIINPENKNASDDDKFLVAMLTRKNGKSRTFSNENVIDKLFDTLPADTLLTLNNNIKSVISLEDELDSAFLSVFDILMCRTDEFVISHELGHSKDSVRIPKDANILELNIKDKNPLASKNQFRKAYTEEKAAFIKEFPNFKEKFISYFLEGTENKPERGRKETVAESNAINGLKPEPVEVLAMRTILLQRYFPRSIAELTKLMNPITMPENKNSETE